MKIYLNKIQGKIQGKIKKNLEIILLSFLILITINIISVMIRKEKENIYDIRGILAVVSIAFYLVYTIFE